MVNTRSKRQGLKLEVVVSKKPENKSRKVSIDDLNEIASQLIVSCEEEQKNQENESPTFHDLDEEQDEEGVQSPDVYQRQDTSEQISSQYWNGLLALDNDLLSDIIVCLDLRSVGEFSEPYTPIYELLCDVNNPKWELFDSLNYLLTQPSVATHFYKVCSNRPLINVLASFCQNKSQA